MEKKYIKVSQFFPSSQLCSNCGFRNYELKNLSIRNWKCPVCLKEHDRDINAAKNIANQGLKILKVETCYNFTTIQMRKNIV